MIHHRFVSALLIAACLSLPALAQINPFRGSSSTPLNADDIAALTEATNRLLDRPQLVVGGTETWRNVQSGASGTITAGAALQHKGMACRTVRYQTIVPGPRPERSTTATWCRTPEGWKLA